MYNKRIGTCQVYKAFHEYMLSIHQIVDKFVFLFENAESSRQLNRYYFIRYSNTVKT